MDIGKSKRKKIKSVVNKLQTKLYNIRLNDSTLGIIIPHNKLLLLWHVSATIENVLDVVTPQDRDDKFGLSPR